ncbi:MAG TPA: zinc ABC transporter substrate-binding protein [Acidimicrobiia bacterium]|nr:zinc ABC transporter substrate-binding protein [Acidimicrobiia bacterium]
MVLRILAGLTALVLVTGACGRDDDDQASDGQPRVVAAFSPVAWAADQIGGGAVAVQNLTPAGAEPHDLELTTGDVDDIEDADLVIVMGHDFQPGVEDAADRRSSGTLRLLDHLDVDTDDPHVWLDPIVMGDIVDEIERALATVDPPHASEFAANAAALHAELDTLDGEYRSGLGDCERDLIVTSHEAFGHLARRYGLEQHAIAGVDPEQEPNANRIAELADLVEEHGVTTIFTEELVSPRVAESLAREAGVQTETLNPLEGLTDDERAAGDDYLSVMRANLEKLRTALGCR